MNAKEFAQQLRNDVKVELAQEFDRNFERKAFFDKNWPSTKHQYNRGSLLARSGKLRRSIKSKISGNGIVFTSSLPYVSIHNEGGTITVTPKMKRYFWAMYYKSNNAITKKKDGTPSKSQRNQKLTAEAKKWKALALQKAGSKMKIEQRQFIGNHPRVGQLIETIADGLVEELQEELTKKLNQ